jgi:hypothetical protein
LAPGPTMARSSVSSVTAANRRHRADQGSARPPREVLRTEAGARAEARLGGLGQDAAVAVWASGMSSWMEPSPFWQVTT